MYHLENFDQFVFENLVSLAMDLGLVRDWVKGWVTRPDPGLVKLLELGALEELHCSGLKRWLRWR